MLAVTATGREAEDLAAALGSLLPEGAVAEFPAWETLPHERLSPRSDTVGRRLAVLRRLSHPEDADANGPLRVVVAPVRSLLQPLVAGLGELVPVALRAGDEIPLDDAVERLVAAAYTRVDLVEKRGEFAVRGGILDVFPPTEEHPLRVEYWGDTVEEVRWFKVADQRSLEVADDGLWAPPCRELLLTDEVRARAEKLAVDFPGLADVFGQLAEGIAVEGMESLAPVLTDRLELLPDLLPAGAHILLCDPERIRTRAHDLVATSEEFLAASWAAAAAGGATPLDLGAAAYRSLAEVRGHARELDLAWWSVTPFAPDEELQVPDDEVVVVHAHAAEAYRGDTDAALADVRGWLDGGWRVVLVTEGHGPAERLHERLRDAGIPSRVEPDLATAPGTDVVQVACGSIEHGFTLDDVKLALLTETDLVGQRSSTKDMRRLPSRRRHQVDPLQLKPGDFVVHEQHGVGKYVEMAQRTVAGATREYLVVEYAASKRGQPGDRLYVPTDQLDQVTRYVGGESPTLQPAGRLGLGQDQGPGPQGGPRDRGRADPAVQRADGVARARVRPGHPLAARAGGRVPLRRDARPAVRHRRGQGGHGAAGPDGPADLRGRRLRQDRDRRPGRVQGGAGRQAGRRPRADHAAGAAAPVHVRRAVRELPGRGQGAVEVPDRQGGRRGRRGHGGRHRGRRHRHPPAAHPEHPVQGPRPGDRRRGAAVRRRAQGAAQAGSAPRWTCWPCRPRRSRGPWRWRSPASARCP